MQINIEKRHVFIISAILVLLAGIIIVIAVAPAWDTTKTVYHSASDVKVTIAGDDYSLQDAIDEGMLGGSSSMNCHWESADGGGNAETNEKTTCDVGNCIFKVDQASCNPADPTCVNNNNPLLIDTCARKSPDRNEYLFCCPWQATES